MSARASPRSGAAGMSGHRLRVDRGGRERRAWPCSPRPSLGSLSLRAARISTTCASGRDGARAQRFRGLSALVPGAADPVGHRLRGGAALARVGLALVITVVFSHVGATLLRDGRPDGRVGRSAGCPPASPAGSTWGSATDWPARLGTAAGPRARPIPALVRGGQPGGRSSPDRLQLAVQHHRPRLAWLIGLGLAWLVYAGARSGPDEGRGQHLGAQRGRSRDRRRRDRPPWCRTRRREPRRSGPAEHPGRRRSRRSRPPHRPMGATRGR